MQDRVPAEGQEGRVLITPEDGSAPFYAKVTMADNPTQPGTPLNKETLLQDATAALFNKSSDAVPNEIFKSIKGMLDDANQKVDDLIVCGSYTGNGTTQRTINLGFKPRAVMLSYSGFFVLESNDNLYFYGGFLTDDPSLTLTGNIPFNIVDSGFIVRFEDYARTNVNGNTYYYVAIR